MTHRLPTDWDDALDDERLGLLGGLPGVDPEQPGGGPAADDGTRRQPEPKAGGPHGEIVRPPGVDVHATQDVANGPGSDQRGEGFRPKSREPCVSPGEGKAVEEQDVRRDLCD